MDQCADTQACGKCFASLIRVWLGDSDSEMRLERSLRFLGVCLLAVTCARNKGLSLDGILSPFNPDCDAGGVSRPAVDIPVEPSATWKCEPVLKTY